MAQGEESLRVRDYRRQLVSQGIMAPRQYRERCKTDPSKSHMVYASLVHCHGKERSPEDPLVNIDGFTGKGSITPLFTMPISLWQELHGDPSLMATFDEAIVGATPATVVSRVRRALGLANVSEHRSLRKWSALGLENAIIEAEVLVDDTADEYEYLFDIVGVEGLTGNRLISGWYADGLKYCSNAFACPICSSRRAGCEQKRLKRVIDTAYKIGLTPFMFTFTHSHKKGESLTDAFAIVSESFKRWRSSKAFKTFVSLCAPVSDGKLYMPYYDSTEVTLGKIFYRDYDAAVEAFEAEQRRPEQLSLFPAAYDLKNHFASKARAENSAGRKFFDEHSVHDFVNGWHVHKHALFFIRRYSMTDYFSLIQSLKESWADRVVKVTKKVTGRELTEKQIEYLRCNGLDCSTKPASTSAYICKKEKRQSAWGAEKELTRSNAWKRGDIDLFTLLDNPKSLDKELWATFVAGCRHQHRYHVSPGFDAFFKAHEFDARTVFFTEADWAAYEGRTATAAAAQVPQVELTLADIQKPLPAPLNVTTSAVLQLTLSLSRAGYEGVKLDLTVKVSSCAKTAKTPLSWCLTKAFSVGASSSRALGLVITNKVHFSGFT